MNPTVLVATTERWFPTARLAMTLRNAGFAVKAVCPSGHPVNKTGVAQRIYGYDGLRPQTSFAAAIAAAKPDLIVPGDDLSTRHLHQLHQNELDRKGAGAELCVLIERSLGAPESFPIVFARTRFMDLAQGEGVCAPKTEVITGRDDLKKWADRAGLPIVLKSNGTSGGDGVRIVHTMAQAERALRTLAAPRNLARAVKRTILDRDSTLLWPSVLRRRAVVNAQAFIAGREATSAIACWNGAVLASLHFEVVNKVRSTGHATVLRVIENDEMSKAAERIVRGLKLSGLHGLDFMLEAQTGKAHLIEINPRATQVVHLTLGPGRDLAAALYAAVCGETVSPAPKVTESDVIALFPQEWIRDPASPFLSSGYHDVPWQAPDLVRVCALSRRKQSRWYSPKKTKLEHSGQPIVRSVKAPCQQQGIQ